jgi:hypothetical protein
MPVEAQRCGVVAELAVGGLEDYLRQMLHGFAWVHLATSGEDGCDVDALSVRSSMWRRNSRRGRPREAPGGARMGWA